MKVYHVTDTCVALCVFFADFMHCSFIFGKCAVFIYKTQHLFFGKHLVVGFMLLFRWNFSKGQLKVHTEYVEILCVLSYSNATGITKSCKISFKCLLLTIGWNIFYWINKGIWKKNIIQLTSFSPYPFSFKIEFYSGQLDNFTQRNAENKS